MNRRPLSKRYRWLVMPLMVIAGCDRTTPAEKVEQPPAVPSEVDASLPSKVAVEVGEGESESESEQVSAPEPVVLSEPPEPMGPFPMEPLGHHRLWIPTTSGPLLVDLDLWIGQTRLIDLYDARLDGLMAKLGGTDEPPTWREALTKIASDSQSFDDAVTRAAGQPRDVMMRYDLNRNKRVEREELAKFVFQTSGFWSPLRVRGTAAFRQANRAASPTWKAIDVSGDGVLSDPEYQSCEASLLSAADRNGDRRIDLAEVSLGAGRMANRNDDPWNVRRTNRRGDVAMDFDGFIDWQAIAYSINRVLPVHPMAVAQPLGERLDRNSDGEIDRAEAERLKWVPADLHVTVRFDEGGNSPPTVQMNERIQSAGRPEFSVKPLGRQGVLVQTDQFQWRLRATDQSGPAGGLVSGGLVSGGLVDGGQISGVQVRGRAAEVPDAVFAWLDRDHDQSLSSRELRAAGARLRDAGVKRATDIPDAFEVHLGRGPAGQDEALFAAAPIAGDAANRAPDRPRWAERMDANGDGDISQDEFLGLPQHFQRLDVNGDQFLDAAEVGVQM